MTNQISGSELWLSVVGKCLALLCLEAKKSTDVTLVDRARFLESLGIERKVAAEMLGTSSASITEMFRQAKKKKGVKANGSKKRK